MNHKEDCPDYNHNKNCKKRVCLDNSTCTCPKESEEVRLEKEVIKEFLKPTDKGGEKVKEVKNVNWDTSSPDLLFIGGNKPTPQEDWSLAFDEKFKITERFMPNVPVYWVKDFIAHQISLAEERGYVARGVVESEIKKGIALAERQRCIEKLRGMTGLGYGGGDRISKAQAIKLIQEKE